MTRLLTAASLIALSAAPAPAHDPVFDSDKLSTHVRTLSADAFEGRAPDSLGEAKTVAYLAGAFAAAGLQPGGEPDEHGLKSWTQDVPLMKSSMVDEPLVHLTMGDERIQLTQGEEIAVRAPMNGMAQVQMADKPLVFVGYGVTAPERGWDDYKDVDVKDKIVVLFINDPDFEGGEGDFGGKEMTYYGRWTYKYEEAAKRGAAGVMVIHETEPASYGWATVRNSNNTTFDIVRDDPAKAHTGLESWIQRDLAAKIFEASGMSFEEAKNAAKRKNFQPVTLNAKLDATVLTELQKVEAKNVVGILPGTTRADEYVIYTAHHDHLGMGDPDEHGDTIFNGALDNATGLAHLIEQARAFAEMGPQERSVIFLAVGAEERGLLGSKYYAANPLYPLSTTAAVINTDSLGVFGPASDFSISGTARLDLLDLLIADAKAMGKSFSPDPRPEAGGFFRSDHFPFAQAGVPAVSFRSGQALSKGGAERAAEIAREYVANHYHQQGDEWSREWDFSGIAENALLLHRVGEKLANSSEWPNWAEGSEFRAVRDQSADQRD
ncbi:M28 family peptidase [Sphingomicrobium lutaoense]|uniref:Zn-dependent M28 family amino/carboxypeptidase n=1 Tax=Sphingomicrobium lutaoense TaxID=515949 RepID=A0A839Z0X0_9SPHN|nr:M28 family peptidase [Sphingomicrobium lutaoense]MBB3763322.1 Zn-dependent M28 family amino/carboxypeptidase [Sphingomicrobium lutaoense]